MEYNLFEENDLTELFLSMIGMMNAVKPEPEIQETHSSYLAKINMPGVNQRDIHISIEDGGYVVVKAYRSYGMNELSYKFRVNPDISKDSVHARYENGTLYLVIDKIVHCLGKKDQSVN